ncbi:MFS transporter [Chitinimonas sp. BJB300]|uniref:MFS transporter n=1 Tax=Chitinimonas sp. BJB300 TaxID=1559339 RepID=UPI000C1131BF|nr:MFS transporter [Chitinimonas sp. BJB300]PHV12104.1 MFS transporter [Chitinimonas sp. BJB300]TSJ89068.1 multidrug effflux MFS transporter [Chitinimonas sp. BJB300]
MDTRKTAGPPLMLLMLLLGFPQLSETIYAPVLPDIARVFNVTAGQAQWTMSIYFIAFAAGVVYWGRLADHWGRRPALWAALCCYGGGALLALYAPDFTVLLLARMLLAFGASAGSIVVQTILRDTYQGAALGVVFSTAAAVLSLSPALGPPAGALLAAAYGHTGVFAALCILALLLLASSSRLVETKPVDQPPPPPFIQVARRVLADRHILASAVLVAGFNLLLFGYYTLAPFTLAQLGMPHWLFGASGLMVAAASGGGAWLNRHALQRHTPARLVRYAVFASITGSVLQWVCVYLLGDMPVATAAGLLLTQAVLLVAYGCAIPNVLSTALLTYRSVQGSAGALFSLLYYLAIAGGLGLVGTLYQPGLWFQPMVMLMVSLAMWPALRRLSKPL